MLSWSIKAFEDLTLREFHDLIALRIDVFIVEQNCPYPELDGKDEQSYHLIGRNENSQIVATSRILPPGLSYPQVSIGRVVVTKNERMNNYGHDMMRMAFQFILEKFGNTEIKISAQKYLESFYLSHDFVPTGKEYLEDGIPHLEMIRYKNK